MPPPPKLETLAERLRRNRPWFSKNQSVTAFLEFMNALLEIFAAKWRAVS